MTAQSFFVPAFTALCLASCSTPSSTGESGGADTTTSGEMGGSGGAGSGGESSGGNADACASSEDATTVHLAADRDLDPGEEGTMCMRWTTPSALSIHGYKGTLGSPFGHHALLLGQTNPT